MIEDIGKPGRPVRIADGVRRLLAPNAGRMTGPGTNTYLIGDTEIAVLDPGPKIDQHVDAILDACKDQIRWILVTHTHPDHSPAAAILSRRTGAPLLGMPPPPGPQQDQTFLPDRALNDGDTLETAEFCLRAVHTPGHASNHLCYRHESLRWLFTGDHIMHGSTVVIDPPDGNMSEYLLSLERLKTLNLDALAPGHGLVIDDPDRLTDALIAHRLKREESVATVLGDNNGLTLEALTQAVYRDVHKSLHRLASRSLLAHLHKLREDGRAVESDGVWRSVSDVGKATP